MHRVPAIVLADTIVSAQRAVHLLAMSQRGGEVHQRLHIPPEVLKRFVLLCEIPEAGSYLMPAVVGTDVPSLFQKAEADAVVSKFKRFGEAITNDRLDGLDAVVPMSAIRLRVLEAFADMMPNPGTGLSLELSNGTGTFATFDEHRAEGVREYVRAARAARAVAPATITGYLSRIDLARNTFAFRPHGSKRSIPAAYPASYQDDLLANARRPLRLSGTLQRDGDDRPTFFSDLKAVVAVDLSPVEVETVQGAVRTLRFRDGARAFEPVLDESGTLIVVEDADLGIHVYTETRDTLLAALIEDIEVLWLEFAEADPEDLTPDAQRLRASLLEALVPA